MNECVKMAVDQGKLVNALKMSFTNTTTVLAELMQNARRAGASAVRFDYDPDSLSLSVTDNGCGMESVESLLTVAASGWDASVAEVEHPYGIGFLSALYACERIEIKSRGFRLEANTFDILSFEDVAVESWDWDGRTVIVLKGLRMTHEEIKQALEKYAKGYPIPVLLDGEALPRPFAVDGGLDYEANEIGHIHLRMDTLERYGLDNLKIFLQGIPVYQNWRSNIDCVIVHLDSSKFHARLPDRDKLIDQDKVLEVIKMAIKEIVTRRFLQMKQTMSPAEFADWHGALKDCGLLALLNDVPVVPKYALLAYTDYPNCCSDNFSEYTEFPKSPVLQEDILSGKVKVVKFAADWWEETGGIPFVYVYKKGYLVINGDGRYRPLDDGHWLHAHVRDLDAEEWNLTMAGETHSAYFSGEWVSGNVHFCQSYAISYGGDSVACDMPVCSEFTGFIVPFGAYDPGDVLSQASNYDGDNDDFQSGLYEVDKAAFNQFVVANTATDLASALKALIPERLECPPLFGKAFRVTLDGEGRLNVEAI